MDVNVIKNIFDRINQLCKQTGGTVVPFSCDEEHIQYYVQQMHNMDFDYCYIDNFRCWLRIQPSHKQKTDIIRISSTYEQSECVEFIHELLDLLNKKQIEELHSRL